jgi:hypothetical protein
MATLSSTRFQAGGLRTLSILMGVFLLFMGVG